MEEKYDPRDTNQYNGRRMELESGERIDFFKGKVTIYSTEGRAKSPAQNIVALGALDMRRLVDVTNAAVKGVHNGALGELMEEKATRPRRGDYPFIITKEAGAILFPSAIRNIRR